jgi:hypothetical protein
MSNPFRSVENGSVSLRGTLKLALLGLNPLLKQGITFTRTPKACLLTANRRPNMGTEYTHSMVANQHWPLQLEDVYAPANVTPTWKTFYGEIYYDQKPTPEKVEQWWFMSGAGQGYSWTRNSFPTMKEQVKCMLSRY